MQGAKRMFLLTENLISRKRLEGNLQTILNLLMKSLIFNKSSIKRFERLPFVPAWKPECKLIVFRPFYFYENAKGEIVTIDELVNFPD
jgi:hypothetical protein